MTDAQSIQALQSLPINIRGDVYIDPHRRGLYATDASIYQVPPAAVVAPRDGGDVVTAIQFASDQGISVTARGGGTSLSGQSIGSGIVLDFSRYMNDVLDVDAEGRTATVQPGVVLDELNRRLAGERLIFGPDVSTIDRATLGGMIGNNSAGSRSICYGKTVDNLRQIEFVGGDGRSRRLGPCRLHDFAGDDPLLQRIGGGVATHRGAARRCDPQPVSRDSATRQRVQSR